MRISPDFQTRENSRVKIHTKNSKIQKFKTNSQKLLIPFAPFVEACSRFYLRTKFILNISWLNNSFMNVDWFSANIYLLVLGIVLPYCSFPLAYSQGQRYFVYFATYNTIRAISNVLFLLIRYCSVFILRLICNDP